MSELYDDGHINISIAASVFIVALTRRSEPAVHGLTKEANGAWSTCQAPLSHFSCMHALFMLSAGPVIQECWLEETK